MSAALTNAPHSNAVGRLPGRHFLQTPGPTNLPDTVLRAMDRNAINHRGPEFGRLGRAVIAGMREVFGTQSGMIALYPASGTGAWEAALVNTLSPGDHVLMSHTGWFAHLWEQMAERLGLVAVMLETDWRRGADPAAIADALSADKEGRIKAVCVVHNETSTSCLSDVAAVRHAIDKVGHGALLMVDAISSLGCGPFEFDGWGVDVAISGSQKGLMVPPGLSFNAVSPKAMAAGKTARLARGYWDWAPLAVANETGFFPYTPAVNLLYALEAAIGLMRAEGFPAIYARHARFAEATRRAAAAWGLELQCLDARAYSPGVTAVRVPEGHSADKLRGLILEHFDMSLGNGLGRIEDRVFRIGHMGDINALQLMGALAGVEMGLALAGIPHRAGGVQAAAAYLAETA
ncbi:MAG: aminotransferase class V-fold PLP-dependent enzyme [Rhodospirillales bacterium]|nr:aminotransferase class V-fold PLP-dependent enzyme [Rhodospirillales bacterium]